MLSVPTGVAFFGGVAVGMFAAKGRSQTIRDHRGKIVAFVCVVFTVGVVLIMTSYNDTIGNSFFNPNLPDPEDFYGIMFDAGSTGSRIHVFNFRDSRDGTPYELLDELFLQVKPGLSAFADDPEKGANSLRSMLDQAKTYIPENQWGSSPVVLKATAGLRLLPDKTKADALLLAVTKLLESYPFKVPDNAVQIMGGDEEGIYSWFTVNFLTKLLRNPVESVGVMDLGGGSTQITFVPSNQETIQKYPGDYLRSVSVMNIPYTLYTHSYLGLGLLSGRFQTLGGSESFAEDKKENYKKILTSSCLPTNHTSAWTHGGKNYTLKGASKVGRSRYEDCYEAAKIVIGKYNIHKPIEIINRSFITISYYYEKALQANLIGENGGDIRISQFLTAASDVCKAPSAERPFQCADLCYISALIKDGFGFSRDSYVSLKKKIDGMEISWALGATFDLISGRSKTKDA